MDKGWKAFPANSPGSCGEERVHMDSPEADATLGRAIFSCGHLHISEADQIIVLCVGTDRSIGDALGPLVGTDISETGTEVAAVYGTVDNPVHAGNLSETVSLINRQYRRPFVIAVDACLGRTGSIGIITVGKGSLKPGAGVNKTLPAVGNIYVTGVVNVGGFMEYFVLQNTRLSLVMRMARVASRGIRQGLRALVDSRRGARPSLPSDGQSHR